MPSPLGHQHAAKAKNNLLLKHLIEKHIQKQQDNEIN